MKKILFFLLVFAGANLLGAQTTVDKPAATIKLTRQEVISVRQIKADVQRLEKTTGTTFTLDQIKLVLEARINSLLFVQFCEREKISVTDTEINNALSQMKARLGPSATDADLENQLKAGGVFVEPKIYVRQRLLFEKYVQAKRMDEFKAAVVPPTADEVLKAYDLAKASLVRPDTMRVSILYVDTRGQSETESKKARDTIQSIASALKVNAAKFDEYILRAGDASGYKAIASLYLEKTSQNRTMFGPELFDGIFKLKAGEVSPLIESPTGLRIVRANEFLPQKQLGLADPVPGNPNMTVQQFIAYQVTSDKEAKFMGQLENELITKLRSEASVKTFEENLK